MRAAVCRAHGDPGTVEVTDLGTPELTAGEVLVGARAAAVNFPDVLLVAGEYQMDVPPPFVPGSDFAGEVLAVADDVESVRLGDKVFGTVLVGAFAEQVRAPASSLTAVPDGVSWERAAAFGVAHRTAWNVLVSVARLGRGEELLVLGAGGGVGLAAVQLGSILGATVTAVASSPEKLEVAREMGARRCVSHRGSELRDALRELLPGGTDVVLDPVGGDLSEPALRSLRWGGRFVTVGFASGEIPRIPLNLVLLKGVTLMGFQFIDFVGHAPEAYERNEAALLDLFGSGQALPHIGARFSLADVADALRLVSSGRAVGKVVITIG